MAAIVFAYLKLALDFKIALKRLGNRKKATSKDVEGSHEKRGRARREKERPTRGQKVT